MGLLSLMAELYIIYGQAKTDMQFSALVG